MAASSEKPRLHIAYFSPLPPMRSGIATYSANLLPHLARRANLTLFAENPEQIDAELRQQFVVRDIDSFAGLWAEDVDICLYHMGNNTQYHEKIYALLHRYPGLTMLHDVNLHSFLGEIFLPRRQFAAYLREMAFSYGRSGINQARQTRQGTQSYDIRSYPLFDRIVQSSLGVAVHSRYAYETVNGRCPHIPIAHIPFIQADLLPRLPTPAAAKANLGLPPETILLASFGYIAPSKRIEPTLRAVAKLSRSFPHLQYALVGQIIEGYNLRPLITELNLENQVQMVGYADETTYQTYLAAADIGINLRYPSLGETSSTLYELLGAAKPTLVSNVDAFIELPDEICVKIEVDDQEEAQIEATLHTLITNAAQRQQLGHAAGDYIRQECHPEIVAEKYIRFISQLLGSR